MINQADQKQLMVQYLFGELPADERSRFEDLYLKDGALFQELVALENELIDQYILGELSETERERFERSLQTSHARRKMVETARSLLAYSAAVANTMLAQAPKSNRWFGRGVTQMVKAAVVLIVIGGSFWVLLTN